MAESLFITVLAAVGLGISLYIYRSKKLNRPLLCPVGKGCNAVVASPYAVTLGIPNEVSGILYYALVIASQVAAGFSSLALNQFVTDGLVVLAAVAALFSVYLIFIQAFVLRKWCEWCIMTSLVNIAIFLLLR